jgi:hypothetical protein
VPLRCSSLYVSVVSRISQTLLSQSPSLCFACAVPPDTAQREAPTLVTSYCATCSATASTFPSLSTPRRFPWPDVQSGSGTQFMLHRLRTTAQCLWLYVAPHSTLVGAVTGLSYPSTPDFSRCQLRQVSPLQFSYVAIRSDAIQCGTGHALPIRPPSRSCTDFRMVTGQQAISCLPPFPCRPTSYNSIGCMDWVEEGSFTLQLPSQPHQPY